MFKKAKFTNLLQFESIITQALEQKNINKELEEKLEKLKAGLMLKGVKIKKLNTKQ